MEKLVLVYSWGDESCCGTSHLAFEYKSKDDFIFDCLELVAQHKKTKDYRPSGKNKYEWYDKGSSVSIPTLKDEFYVDDVEDFENWVFTLDKWFEYQKLNNL